ncbi:MAG: sodium:solute symporter family transporter, partial [Candidatus Neomarinimicrobiota bacterium]
MKEFKILASNENYFLGDKNISWKKSMFSIVATETSLLTFMSLPGIGFRLDNLFFLQLAMGYVIGRLLSAYFLIPMYYKSNIISIYELIGNSFGLFIQKVASFIFLITRLLADGVRFLLTAIVIQQILGISIELCIIIIGVA